MTTRWPTAGLAILLSAIVAIPSACSSSRAKDAGTSGAPNDADAPDTFQDTLTPDAFQDVRTFEVVLRDARVPDTVEDAEARDAMTDALSDDEICMRTCETRAAAGCRAPNPQCAPNCRRDLAMGLCYQELRRLQLCILAIGPDAYACVNGAEVLEVCLPEQQALTACLFPPQRDAARD
jgi:hypothetical protein